MALSYQSELYRVNLLDFAPELMDSTMLSHWEPASMIQPGMVSSLKIGYRRYRVETANASGEADHGRDAHINRRTGRIILADDQPPERVAYLLLHEILHGLIHDAAIDWPVEEEEAFVQRMTPRLVAFMADNPNQVRSLLEMLAYEEPPGAD